MELKVHLFASKDQLTESSAAVSPTPESSPEDHSTIIQFLHLNRPKRSAVGEATAISSRNRSYNPPLLLTARKDCREGLRLQGTITLPHDHAKKMVFPIFHTNTPSVH
jgi:hypothetical protein